MPEVLQLRDVTGVVSNSKGVSGGHGVPAARATCSTASLRHIGVSCSTADCIRLSMSACPSFDGTKCGGRPSPSTPLGDAATASSVTMSEIAATSTAKPNTQCYTSTVPHWV